MEVWFIDDKTVWSIRKGSAGPIVGRAGQHDQVPVGISKPQLLLLGVRILVDVVLDPRSAPPRTGDRRGEVRDLEPQQRAVSERDACRRERAMVIFDVETMELEEDLALVDDLLVLVASVPTLGTQQLDVKTARRWDVADGDERLRPDPRAHATTLGG